MSDITMYRCTLCGQKEQGRIDMMGHLKDAHTFTERAEALMENIESGPRTF